MLFDAQGRIAAIRHHWRFDEAFTAFAIQGLDSDGDGRFTPAELQPLAQENVEALSEYGFFTTVSVGDYLAGFAAPKDYGLEYEEARLTLHYTLPLARPLASSSGVLLQVYDPEYYIAFALPSRDAVRLVDAPASCRLQVTPAQGPDAAAVAALATIGPEQRELPAEMQEMTGGIDNSAEIHCGGPVAGPVAMGDGAKDGSGAAAPAADAARMMAGAVGAADADLRALPPAPGSVAPPPAPRPDGLAGRLAAWQSKFNRDLTDALKGLKADGSAFWWLGGVSFLYGILHAAGPGHGKVVISSYLFANEARLRRGVGIAFLSALLQALVAIGIVGAMAAILDMTSMAMTRTAGLMETGSFALVALLGLYLLLAKGRAALAAWQGGDPHAGHHHGHNHAHDHGAACGCGHHAAPAALERTGLRGAAAAVLSVGIRPCSGALVVLVFALAQGIFWAGVASTLLMALGTAITVAALAALAVGAKDVARRLARGDGRRSAHVMLFVETAAALFITVMGVALFAGSLAA